VSETIQGANAAVPARVARELAELRAENARFIRHKRPRDREYGWTARRPIRLGALLTEFGKEHGPPFLESGELSPELFQLAVDPCQFGPRLLSL